MSDCIEFRETSRTPAGYGLVKVNGKMTGAHQQAWRKAHGPIPEGMVVRHTCDNPPCINPEHLIIGTHQDNADDREERNRTCHGERHHNHKLTEEQARKILADTRPATQIAPEYGVRYQTVQKIRTRQSWKHLS